MRSHAAYKQVPGMNLWAVLVVAASVFVLLPASASAQTFTVLHTFTGGADGFQPAAGLTIDRGGNLYGTTPDGGNQYGVVFKLQHRGSSWVETPIYKFAGYPDGANPYGRVILGPDGALYGTTKLGGSGDCFGQGCGTVFKLQPPQRACPSIFCPWRKTILYNFSSFADGAWPSGEVTFDQAGNLYGTTWSGGSGPCNYGAYSGCGTVFQLTHNPDGTWTKSTLYSFQGGATDGINPGPSLVLDASGNVYGVTVAGAGTGCNNGSAGCGTVFELSPSGSAWVETVLHVFTGDDGVGPTAVTFDGQGDLYGSAYNSTGGEIFELSPLEAGGWNFSVAYTFTGQQVSAPGPLTIDASGNIYGTSADGGAFNGGTAYKLTQSNGAWSYTNLYSFGADDGSTGFDPESQVVLDSEGTVYGTCAQGPYPDPNGGTAWEITP